MTLKEWDLDAEQMTDKELESRIAAIAELQLWPAFKREFGWTGYATLLHTMQNEQSARKHKLTPKSAWEHILPSLKSEHIGWTTKGDFACPHCTVQIGRNLREQKPLRLAADHLATHSTDDSR